MRYTDMKFRYWSDRQIKSKWNNRGGRYKDALTYLILERSMTFDRRLRFFVNQDIAQIMRRIV
jgi:hypothetical protein